MELQFIDWLSQSAMNRPLKIVRFSSGVWCSSAHPVKAQQRICIMAARPGAEIFPAWNKPDRDHPIAGSVPSGTRPREA
ncbi:MAG: hypothetical protein ABSA45_09225, partial [Verrucomicrobiota bacterium]